LSPCDDNKLVHTFDPNLSSFSVGCFFEVVARIWSCLVLKIEHVLMNGSTSDLVSFNLIYFVLCPFFYILSFFSSMTDAMLYYPASVVYLSVCLDETTSIQMELLITLMARTVGLGSKFKKVFRFGLTQQTRDDSSLTNSLHPEGGRGVFFFVFILFFFQQKEKTRPD